MESIWNADGVIFDMDGVVTDTASVHIGAWRELFDGYLAGLEPEEEDPTNGPHRSFSDDDYRRFVDGRARIDGISEFLGSRGIEIPLGTTAEGPSNSTRWGLANRKNDIFLARTRRDGVSAFASTIKVIERLRAAEVPVGVVTASRNAEHILDAAGASGLFDACIDGLVAAELGLPGKPDPATFLEAARRLAVDPARSVVFEDAISGVQAGSAGGFGLVIGVDRTGHGEALTQAGAHLVVTDLGQLL